MIQKLQALHRRLEQVHQLIYDNLLTLEREVSQQTKESLIDRAYLLRELRNLSDDIRKECDRTHNIMCQAACMLWVTENVNEPHNAKPIHGEIARGTPTVKTMASLPKPGNKTFTDLMKWLGIEGQGAEVCRPHWPSMIELITARTQRGEPLPPGMGKTYTKYSVILNRRNC